MLSNRQIGRHCSNTTRPQCRRTWRKSKKIPRRQIQSPSITSPVPLPITPQLVCTPSRRSPVRFRSSMAVAAAAPYPRYQVLHLQLVEQQQLGWVGAQVRVCVSFWRRGTRGTPRNQKWRAKDLRNDGR